MTDPKNSDSLFGVTCEVMGCKYHDALGACTAQNINVQTPDASKKTETYCGTFCSNC
jgi:hypothetical protein